MNAPAVAQARERIAEAEAFAKQKRREADESYIDAIEALGADGPPYLVDLIESLKARIRQRNIEEMLDADFFASPVNSRFAPTWNRLRSKQHTIERLLAS